MLLSLGCVFAQNKEIEALSKIKGINYQFIDKDMVVKSILSGKPICIWDDVTVNLNTGTDSFDGQDAKTLNCIYGGLQILLAKNKEAAVKLKKGFSKFVKAHHFNFNFNGSRKGDNAQFYYGSKETGIRTMMFCVNKDGETGLVVLNGNANWDDDADGNVQLEDATTK